MQEFAAAAEERKSYEPSTPKRESDAKRRLSAIKKSSKTVQQSVDKRSETVDVHVVEMDDDESMDKMRQITSANVNDSEGDDHNIIMPPSNQLKTFDTMEAGGTHNDDEE